jgi:aminoglycoside 3-N-acetyltransferase
MIQTKQLKGLVKRHLKALRRRLVHAMYPFDARRLQLVLADLGVQAGDTLLVHSSFDAFEGFQGKPNDVIHLLQACVGSAGLLMMPTMTFTGSAIEVARSDTLFDVRRTPSRMGMISELFRRSAGVVRSVHPTHPVACWGLEAAAVAQGHHLSETPCGRGTPFETLLKRRGKIVLLGTDISVLTFYHHLEEVFERELPVTPFTDEDFTLRSRTADGDVVETRCRLYAPAVSRRRNLYKLVPYLKKRGAWREGRVGRLKIAVLQADGVEAAMREMNQLGIYCYD